MTRTASERADALPMLAEVFREYGFEGASLSVISERTGLGKGSLYHFFPGGKDEMAAAVLEQIDGWFETNLFRPLRTEPDAAAAIRGMFRTADEYFRSGGRVCLVGAFAVDRTRDRFAARINAYFTAWRDALAEALRRAGKDKATAKDQAEEIVAGIQGALIAGRALDDSGVFKRTLARLEARIALKPPRRAA